MSIETFFANHDDADPDFLSSQDVTTESMVIFISSIK